MAHLAKIQVCKPKFGSPEAIQFYIHRLQLLSYDSYTEIGGRDKENTWVARCLQW